MTAKDFREWKHIEGLLDIDAQKIYLTATYPPFLHNHFCKCTGLPTDTLVVRAPTSRPELRLHVVHLKRGEDLCKRAYSVAIRLMNLDEWESDTCGLILARSVHDCQEIAKMLGCGAYFSKETNEQKHIDLTMWQGLNPTRPRWIVCTTALSHGINNPRLAVVIEAGLPSGLFEHLQMIGRNSRNHQPSVVVTIVGAGERITRNPADKVLDVSLKTVMETWVDNKARCRRELLSEVMDGVAVTCKDLTGCQLCDICQPYSNVIDVLTMSDLDVDTPMVDAQSLPPAETTTDLMDTDEYDNTTFNSLIQNVDLATIPAFIPSSTSNPFLPVRRTTSRAASSTNARSSGVVAPVPKRTSSNPAFQPSSYFASAYRGLTAASAPATRAVSRTSSSASFSSKASTPISSTNVSRAPSPALSVASSSGSRASSSAARASPSVQPIISRTPSANSSNRSAQLDASISRQRGTTKKVLADRLQQALELLRPCCIVCWAYSGIITNRHEHFTDCVHEPNSQMLAEDNVEVGYKEFRHFIHFPKLYIYCFRCNCPQEDKYRPAFHVKPFKTTPTATFICPIEGYIPLTMWLIYRHSVLWKECCDAFAATGLTEDMTGEELAKWMVVEKDLTRFNRAIDVFMWLKRRHERQQ